MHDDIVPVTPVAGWKSFIEPRPYVTTSGFAFDSSGRFPILFRGPKVRSARNCWSLPSGLHEPGYTLAQQFCIELKEECHLDADPESAIPITVYENIAPDLGDSGDQAQWHWVIHVLAVRVVTLDTFVNSEPDKHPSYKFITPASIAAVNPWGKGLGAAINQSISQIVAAANVLAR